MPRLLILLACALLAVASVDAVAQSKKSTKRRPAAKKKTAKKD